MRIRSLLTGLLAPILFACLPADEGLRGDAWQSIRETGRGTVVIHYVPAEGFAYESDDGTLTGVTIDILEAMFDWVEAEHEVEIARDYIPEEDWRAFYDRVRDSRGGVFGAGNVTITGERRFELQFSPPYLTNVAVLITRDDVNELTTLEEMSVSFQTLDALAFEGTLHQDRLAALLGRYLPASIMQFAHSNPEIIERVSGGGYFAYVDVYNYWHAREQGAPLTRHRPGDEPSEEFGIIMPLNNDWGGVVTAFFGEDDAFRRSARYRRILKTHLGGPLAELLESARREQAAAVP